MAPFMVSRVQPDGVSLVWPKLQPMIQRGLRKACGDTLTESGLFRSVMHNEVDLWVVHRDQDILGGLFLRIDQRERGRALVVLLIAAGSGKGLSHYLPDLLARIREYGTMIGAYTVESYSRPGAARLLSRLGCRPKAMIMELNDVRRT